MIPFPSDNILDLHLTHDPHNGKVVITVLVDYGDHHLEWTVNGRAEKIDGRPTHDGSQQPGSNAIRGGRLRSVAKVRSEHRRATRTKNAKQRKSTRRWLTVSSEQTRKVEVADGHPRGDLGGAVDVRGPGRRWGIVHVGPAPGVCSVDEDGCGYCIGVRCKLPKPSGEARDG